MMKVDIPLADLKTVTVESLEPGSFFMFAQGAARHTAIRLELGNPEIVGYVSVSPDDFFNFRVLRGADREARCVYLPLSDRHMRPSPSLPPRDAFSPGNLLIGDAGAWLVGRQTTGMGDDYWVYVSLLDWTVSYDFPHGSAIFDTWEMVAGTGKDALTVGKRAPA